VVPSRRSNRHPATTQGWMRSTRVPWAPPAGADHIDRGGAASADDEGDLPPVRRPCRVGVVAGPVDQQPRTDGVPVCVEIHHVQVVAPMASRRDADVPAVRRERRRGFPPGRLAEGGDALAGALHQVQVGRCIWRRHDGQPRPAGNRILGGLLHPRDVARRDQRRGEGEANQKDPHGAATENASEQAESHTEDQHGNPAVDEEDLGGRKRVPAERASRRPRASNPREGRDEGNL